MTTYLHKKHTQRHAHTHAIHAHVDWGSRRPFVGGKNGKCEGRDEGDKCPRGPWGYPNGVIHHPSQSHAEQSCQCMNAALLLSAILIMAPVTALINTITSHWKSLRKNSHGLLCTRKCVQHVGLGGVGGAVRYAEGLCPAGWPLCCDFVVHHCPCLMEAWLFLSRCCDNAKCPFYEHGFCPPLYCQHLSPPTPPPQAPHTNTHKQPVHSGSDTRWKNNHCCAQGSLTRVYM